MKGPERSDRESLQVWLQVVDEHLDIAYQTRLRDASALFSVRLTEIPQGTKEVRMKQLYDKLDEYTEGLFKKLAADPRDEWGIEDKFCKRAFLRIVLNKESVNGAVLFSALEAVLGEINPGVWNTACAVIGDYVRTGGMNVMGGRGLGAQ